MKAATHKMTYDEYCLLPNDGKQYELFDVSRAGFKRSS